MAVKADTLKIMNLSMTIITGTCTPFKAQTFNDLWDYEPGVLFFTDIIVLLAPQELKEEVGFYGRRKTNKHDE